MTTALIVKTGMKVSKGYFKEYYRKNKQKYFERAYKWREANKHTEKYKLQLKLRLKKFSLTPKYFYMIIKRNSRLKNREFNLTKEQFLNWYFEQDKLCIYCGVAELVVSKLQGRRLTIDRLDNNKGYAMDNIGLACDWCNQIKTSILTYEEMKKVGKEIVLPKWQKLM